MPVNTSITAGALQPPQQQNPIQQLAALMQIMQAQKQGQLTDMEIQQKQQLLPIQLQQAQLAADKAKRVESFYTPQNMQQFMQPQYQAVAVGPDGMGPTREAGPSVLDFDKLLNAGAAQGVVDPEKLADHRAKLEQTKATRDAAAAQRADAMQMRLYDIETRLQDRQLSREQAATLAAERNRISEMLIEARGATAAAANKPPMGYRWTTDGNLEKIPGGPADDKANAKITADKAAADSAITGLDRLGEQVNLVKQSNLSRITGLVGALPNVPGSEGSDAQARLDALKAQVGFSVLQTLRNASKTGSSGLGQVTQKEHDLLQQQLGSLAKAQSEKEIRRVLDDISAFVESSKDRIRSAHEGGAAPSAPPAGGSGGRPRVSNEAQYNALPKGAEYIAPDGRIKRKQ